MISQRPLYTAFSVLSFIFLKNIALPPGNLLYYVEREAWDKMRLLRLLLALLLLLRQIPGGLITVPKSCSMTITFVGDCLISTSDGASYAGSLNWYAQNYEPTYFFEKVADYFTSDDLTVVNCETVLSDRALPPRDKGDPEAWWFTGPASNARIFSSSGVELASVANNHTYDYGRDGYQDTVEALKNQGLLVAEDGVPVYYEKNGVRVGVLACGIWYSGEEGIYLSALRQMVESSDFQIIYTHGGAESIFTPEEWRQASYRRLIDNGADLVVGCHAHRLQPMERYNGGTIVYGLGNFCFGGNSRPNNRTAIYRCTFRVGQGVTDMEDEIIPCYLYTGAYSVWQPSPIDPSDPNYQKVLDFMNGLTDSPM